MATARNPDLNSKTLHFHTWRDLWKKRCIEVKASQMNTLDYVEVYSTHQRKPLINRAITWLIPSAWAKDLPIELPFLFPKTHSLNWALMFTVLQWGKAKHRTEGERVCPCQIPGFPEVGDSVQMWGDYSPFFSVLAWWAGKTPQYLCPSNVIDIHLSILLWHKGWLGGKPCKKFRVPSKG